MLQALYLSLFRYRLTTPDDREFIWFGNYVTVLTDPLFWGDTWNTVLIMVVTVAVELVIGFAFAMVMHRIIFARGAIRTSILIPYGIITVVSAFAWQFAFSLTNGFVNGWLAVPWIPTTTTGSGPTGRRCSRSWSPRSGRPRRSCRCCSWPGLSQISEDMLEAAKVDGATVVAAAVEGDPPQHAGRDHGRGAVPGARRLPHLRQHLRDDQGGTGHRVGRRSSPTDRASSRSSSGWARRSRCCCS